VINRTCSVDGCTLPVHGKGMCNRHCYRVRVYGEPGPAGLLRDSRERDADGRKRCTTCASWLPETEFRKDAKLADRLSPQCKGCMHLVRVARVYNLRPGQYGEMLEAQGHACELCREPFDGARPHVDHDHTCCPAETSCGACVRALLCASCNHGVGHLRDDPALLRRAADYVENHRLAR
jgi:hypothetical protein